MKILCLALVAGVLLVACGEPKAGAVDNDEEGSVASVDESPAGDGNKEDSSASIAEQSGIKTDEVVPADDSDEDESAGIMDEASLVGNYEGDLVISQESLDSIKEMAADFGQDADQIIAELESVKTSMELRKDGVCIMTSDSVRGTTTQNLTWSLNDEGTEITLTDINDATMPQLVLLVSRDGRELTFMDTGTGLNIKMTYTRQ